MELRNAGEAGAAVSRSGLAGRPGFPAAMNPEPLAGILADHVFQDGVQALGVLGRVAGHLERRIEAQDVALLASDQSANPGMTAAPVRAAILANAVLAQAGVPKKLTKTPSCERRVLIDQNADRLVLLQGAQNGSGAVPFLDQVIAGKLAALFDQAIDARIVERPDHDVHRLGHQAVGEGAELPIAQVRGGEQDAVAGLLGVQ